MSLAALALALTMQTAAPPPGVEPGTVPARPTPYAHAAGGFVLTLPAGWRYLPLEDGSGLVLMAEGMDARIAAFAVAAEPSGVPGLPDDTIDVLILRLDGPGFRRGARVRVPLVVAGENAADRPQAGDAEALSFTGSDEARRWSGIAATRCGADMLLTLEAATADFERARPVFDTLVRSWGLVLTGGDRFPCGGR